MSRACPRSCPLCGARKAEPLHEMRFALSAGSPLPGRYAVVACAQCDFVFADTAGSPEAYEKHYAEHSRYEDDALATGGGHTAADRARIDRVADWLTTRFKPGTRILDVGCGNGGLLEALAARGFADASGLDPAAGCVARVRERGFRAWQGTLGRLPDEARGFDLVILSHVLEHLLAPSAALEALGERLNAGGQVYVETPDASRYAGRAFVPFYFFDSEHINHFDAEALAALGARCGYGCQDATQGEIVVEGGQRYPAVWAVLSRDWAPRPPKRLERLRSAVQGYIQESARRTADPALEALVASGRPLALWGAGSYAQRLLADGPLARVRFAAVVDRDRNKHGQCFAGCEVTPPETGLARLPQGAVVVVAAALAAPAIVAECRAMGLECHVPAHDAAPR